MHIVKVNGTIVDAGKRTRQRANPVGKVFVGNKYRKSNQSWAIARKAHVRSNPTRTYAEVVSE
jgi:hypothetical protein